MKHSKSLYKIVKNVAVVLLLLLTLDCSCMFLGVVQHVITKLPFARFLLAAMVKQSGQKQSAMSLKKLGLATGGLLTAAIANKKQVKAEHVLYRQDENENIIPLDENEYKKIAAEVVDQHQWPTAVKNPEYNPDVDETKVIQEKLDQQFPGVKAMWIPDTLFDAVDYVVSRDCYNQFKLDLKEGFPDKTQHSLAKRPFKRQLVEAGQKHLVNTVLVKHFNAKFNGPALPDVQKAGKLFHDSLDQAIGCDDELKHKTLHSSGEKKLYSLVKPIGVEAMHKAIDIEMAVKENYPHKTVFFRGYGEGIDFNAEDSFYVAKKHSESDYAKTMAGENPSGRKFNKNHRFAVSMRKGAALPSFGAKLLSGLWSNGSDCSLEYIAKSKRGFAIPVSKKELMEESNAIFCIGNDLDSSTAKYRSIGKSGIFFHPRGKAHLSEEKPEIEMQYENLELSWRQPKADHEYFVRDSPRAVIYPTQQEARQGYVDYHEYTLNNAIPLTEPTAKDLKKAKKRGIVE